MISEGSCDTEDWSNDAENHRNKLHFTVYLHRKQLICITIILHIKLHSLGEQKRLFHTHIKCT